MSQAFSDTLDPVSKGIWCPKGFWPLSKLPHLIHPQTQPLAHLYAVKLSFSHLINKYKRGKGNVRGKAAVGNGIPGLFVLWGFLTAGSSHRDHEINVSG